MIGFPSFVVMVRSASVQAALFLIASGLAWGQEGVPAPDVAQVTSDTTAYCAQLAAEAEAVPMPGTARTLHDQGVELCARGHVQAGIARLRRALLITRGAGANQR
jgi:hypothetical protein